MTGDDSFKLERAKAWKNTAKLRVTMDRLSAYWSSPNNVAEWQKFKKNLKTFEAAQAEAEAIATPVNEQPAIKMLAEEVEPEAVALLNILIGKEQKDGSRIGGIIKTQQKILVENSLKTQDAIIMLVNMQWVLLTLGIALGGILSFFTARAIATPLIGMTNAMMRLSEGDLEIEVPGAGRHDEIGEMSKAVQIFKDNAIEKKIVDGKLAKE